MKMKDLGFNHRAILVKYKFINLKAPIFSNPTKLSKTHNHNRPYPKSGFVFTHSLSLAAVSERSFSWFFFFLGSIGGGMVVADNDQEASGTKLKLKSAWKTPAAVVMMLLLLL